MNWITQTVLPKIKALVSQDNVKENMWLKCLGCSQMIFHRDLEEQFHACPTCGYHMPIGTDQRMAMLFDDGDFKTIDFETASDDPLKFRDSKRYSDRLKENRQKTGGGDAILIAHGKIGGIETVIAAFDFSFMGGSMGRSVGNGILKAAETALEHKAALIAIPSSGGARMQEGILSLMQLPRTVIAIRKLKTASLPYIVLLANPTTGGVTASFAMLGDIHIAEPGAVIGFAGRRVIEETVREKLPENFQTAEYLQDHGMVDAVIPRARQREAIGSILSMLTESTRQSAAE